MTGSLNAAAAQWLANFTISTTFPVLADIGLVFAYLLGLQFALVRARTRNLDPNRSLSSG